MTRTRRRWQTLALWSALICSTAGATEAVDDLLQRARMTEPEVRTGAALYRQYCVECHGERGEGNAARAVPVIANQRQAYVIKQFADLHEFERVAPAMHSVLSLGAFAELQSWVDVAAYLNTMTPVTKVKTGDGKHAALGEATYREQCAGCHGADARGDEDGFVPSLRNQHYPYLLREMNQLGQGHRSNVDPELVRFLASLDQEERMGLADYLSRMQGKKRDLTWLRENGVAGD